MDKEGLEYHLAVPNESICTPQEAPLVQDPEDGITSRIEDVLNGRKANTKIDTWEVLWPTLFPDDLAIPDSRAFFLSPFQFVNLRPVSLTILSLQVSFRQSSWRRSTASFNTRLPIWSPGSERQSKMPTTTASPWTIVLL